MNVNNMIVETLDPRNIVSKLYINNYSAKEKSEIVSKARDILSQRDTDNKFYLLNSKSTNPNTDTNNNDYTFKNFKKV
jgi:protein-arginine kinase